jgi:hypothetical protein
MGTKAALHSLGATWMRHFTTLGVLPLLLAPALPALAQEQMISITPEQIGQIFCIGSLGNDMSPVWGVLSEDLTYLLKDASARNNEYQVAHPGEKSPLGDGIPWRSWPDYADGCTVGEPSEAELLTRETNLLARVVINYTFSDAPSANYSDTLILLPAYGENGPPYIWRIHDVELGDGSTLREFIYAAFEE